MNQVTVPDIGDFKEVEVIEILVKPGDSVAKEQSLVTLESDKATMEIPSPDAGVVRELKIKVGDKVSKGALILYLDAVEKAKPAAEKKSGTSLTAAGWAYRAEVVWPPWQWPLVHPVPPHQYCVPG